MSRADRLALLLSLLAVLLSYLVADRVYERMAHIEDEMAFVWQAQAIARGRLTVPTPPEKDSFLVPFVVDYNGQRFGKYPLGWPVVLALGVKLGLRSWVNPLLAGLGVWLAYLLGKRVFGEWVSLLAGVLTLTSPFFLVVSGSLLSHPLGLVLSVCFALAWLDAFLNPQEPKTAGQRWLPTIVSGLALGGLAITRPLTAVAVALPFVLHGLYLLLRSDWSVRRRVLALGMIVLAIGSLHFLWQYAVTGDPLLNPYTLWWPYDKVGFGPGIGANPAGHSLEQAYINTRYSLHDGFVDLFGWGMISLIFIPFGLLVVVQHLRKKDIAPLLVSSVFLSLVVVYLAYWIGSELYGPRYYYEGLYSLTLLSAAGIAWLAGWPVWPGVQNRIQVRWSRARSILVPGLVAVLVAINLFTFLPGRLGKMVNLYGINRARLAPFLSPQAGQYTPALIVVHPKKWTEYGALLELENPFLDTPFIFVHTRGSLADESVAAAFPERHIYHYYTDQPTLFYTAPQLENQ